MLEWSFPKEIILSSIDFFASRCLLVPFLALTAEEKVVPQSPKRKKTKIEKVRAPRLLVDAPLPLPPFCWLL